jgi:hypothetical protein
VTLVVINILVTAPRRWVKFRFIKIPTHPCVETNVSLAILISTLFWRGVDEVRQGKVLENVPAVEPQSQPCPIFFSNLSANVWNVLRPSDWQKSGITSALGLDVLEIQLTNASRLAFCWVRQAMSAFDLWKLDFRCRITCTKIWT